MQFELTKQYKSLQSFTSEEVNGLCVITGKNGSGKTQLVELVSNFKRQLEERPSANLPNYGFIIHGESDTPSVQVNGLDVIKSNPIGRDDYASILYDKYNSIGKKSELLIIIDNIFESLEGDFHFDEDAWFLKVKELFPEVDPITKTVSLLSPLLEGPAEPPKYRRRRALNYLSENFANTVELFIEVAQFRRKKPTILTIDDFFASPINEKHIDGKNLFISELERVFYSYARRRSMNSYQFFLKETSKLMNNSISDQSFTLTNQSPWTVVNSILDRHKIGYTFDELPIDTFNTEGKYVFYLKKTDSNTSVDFQDLSSGEKTIMGLIFKLFITSYYNSKINFPDLLILDEPDSHLHPEMSKLLIEVLNESFVKTLGMTVVFTTHSPSTVALAPEDSIYELKNFEKTSLKKVSKEYALQLLTGNIPTLSIDYKNHRQVFVESPTDLAYYQAVFDKHNISAKLKHKLYFISNGYGNGNCDQVRNIVKQLRTAGNRTSYGIIDWDSTNTSKSDNHIYVHGERKRYSIENYLLDPLYIIALFVDEKLAHNVSELGFNKFSDPFAIRDMKDEQLQQYADWITEKIEAQFPALALQKEMVQLNYINGRAISVPKWFIEKKGHELEQYYRQTFDVFKKFKGEGPLQEQLTTIAVKCYPLIPTDTIKLLELIAN